MLVAEYTDATRIMRVALADGQSHYFNALPDGTEVDITRDQFDVYEPAGEAEERTIGYLVANPDTARRWELLRRRLIERWAL